VERQRTMARRFQEDTLTYWCSRRDCADTLDNLGDLLDGDEAKLDRAIQRATGEAQSILRARWADGWPFASAPAALRGHVAVLATFEAVAPIAIGRAVEGMFKQLQTRRDNSIAWLRDIANGEAHLDLSDIATTSNWGPVAAKAPKGQMGFRG